MVVAVILTVVVATIGSACSDDSGSVSDPVDDAAPLPPNDFEQLAELFDPELRPLGLRLTRGALVDTDDGYEVSDTGRHLAVYVEPTGEYTTADFVDGIVPSAQVFLPEVFERWPRLETFDVCQEPLPADDDREEPPPVTQLYLSRSDSERFDWKTVTLPELIAAAEGAGPEFRLYAAPTVRSDPAYAEATLQAQS